MKAAPLQLYTNDINAEVLSALDAPWYTEQQLTDLGEAFAASMLQQQAYFDAHPPVAVYRCAAEGSQTRDGGEIQQATSGVEITLDNARPVRVAQVGDQVVYADGSSVQIVTGAGAGNSNMALVGSRLANGDEIINTPQLAMLFVVRAGVATAADFLPPVEC